ncbi:hypothetical protein EK904_011269 [Melospiza melodia maxima]|nr:hypothetical protein EK904_011269 [Melospiza melodia maxima]
MLMYCIVCALLVEAGMWINSKGPNETFCSRESWLSGLVSKAECFFRNRAVDLQQVLEVQSCLDCLEQGKIVSTRMDV